ncbi:MAG: carbamoyltransferase [Caldilineaceae bacterium]
MYILGISCFYHDAAAALLQNGKLVAAAEEERFSRLKHDAGFPQQAIEFCLRTAGITARELDYVVFYEQPLPKFERILLSILATVPRSAGLFREAMATWFSEKLWLKTLLVRKLNMPANKVLFVEHHLAHAASAFFCSPYPEAAILTVDGVGEWTTTAMGHATADWGDGKQRNSLRLEQELRFPHSLGLLYSAFTAWLGFQVNNGEYKVMGMAPYGEPRYVEKVRQLIRVASDGSFALDMRYFTFHHSTSQTFNRRFVELFGPPRHPQAEFVTDLTDPIQQISASRTEREQNQYYADVAASIQQVTEETLLTMVRHLHTLTGSDYLCMAGGVALNSVANGRIVREGPFRHVFIQPAAGDSGGALGAALYAFHVLLGQPRVDTLEHAYWGADYAPGVIADFLRREGLPYRELADDQLVAELVEDLTHERVIGWFQGRFEWGPRALGNRSILADPRHAAMKEVVNTKIKFREPFRPFAPAVLEERAQEYFCTPNLADNYLARYMLLVSPVATEKQAQTQATTHIGGTGRLQTVRRAWNQRYYDLIYGFGQATGVPVLLNTSFNLRGEPIVNTPQNAFNTFVGSEIDVLVLGNFILRKDELGGKWDPAVKGAVGE